MVPFVTVVFDGFADGARPVRGGGDGFAVPEAAGEVRVAPGLLRARLLRRRPLEQDPAVMARDSKGMFY